MNNTTRWEIYSPVSIGFEETWKRLDALASNPPSNYPPYNIVRIDGETQQLQLALAGFDKEDIEVSIERKVLNISVQKAKEDAEVAYVHKGISNRTFNRNWQLSEDTVVDEVTFVNGLLKVTLKRELPEEDKRKVLSIG
jgi:molecular chaperone IbpA